MCDLCNNEEEKKVDLTEEEIDNIIVERYNDKDEKTKVFIRKALRVHGDKFDYYKTEYTNAKAKVIVTCREDGEFEVISSNHLRVFCSGGCNSCANRNRANIKKLTTEEFIDRSKKVHGDKYDYSKVNYINNCTKVIINCPEHGSFSQLPTVHLSGGGCPSCSGNKKYTTESFIEEAKKVHGDKYDYSKVDYINANTEVIIGCPKHGLFSQLPLVHLKHECPKCGSEEISRKLTKTTEQFIKEAKEIHGDKYDYDKVNYIGCKEDVIITCLEHGDFKTTPDYHLQGKGCPKCREEEKKNSVSKLSKGVDQFIIDAKKIHGNKYDYSKVNYINAYTNIEIICPIHGSFWQTPHNHLRGRGCSGCNNSIGEDLIKAVLDSQNINYDQRITIKDSNDSVMYPDFVLLDFSIWIEYNGLQHYKYSDDFFHKGMDDFIYQLNRDIRKRVYCKENNIQLIEIPYTFNKPEKIADFLDKVLIKHIDPNTLVDYSKLYKLENTGLNLEDLFPT